MRKWNSWNAGADVRTVEALGLKKVNKTVVLPDNAATRGMVQQVRHLVKVEEEA